MENSKVLGYIVSRIVKGNYVDINYTSVDELVANSIILDVRTESEHKHNLVYYGVDTYMQYLCRQSSNIPIVTELEHKQFKSHKVLQMLVVSVKVVGRLNSYIKSIQDILCSVNSNIVVFCDGGRLRSPIVYMLLKRKYKNVKLLKKGINSLSTVNRGGSS